MIPKIIYIINVYYKPVKTSLYLKSVANNSQDTKLKFLKLNLFSGSLNIKRYSPTCRANQLTSFYMMGTLVVKGLTAAL